MAASSSQIRKGKDFWGELNWDFIHYVGYTYDPRDNLRARAIMRFFVLLTFLIPCIMCRKNLISKYRKLPPTKYMDSQRSLFYYTYVIHDMANKHITKYHPNTPKVSPPFKDVLKKYQNRRGSVSDLVWHIIHIFAATMKYENGEHFKEFLNLIGKVSGDVGIQKAVTEFTVRYNIDPYLLNNNDAFLYTYLLHDNYAKSIGKKIPDFDTTKYFYFRSLGEECNDCKIR